MFSLLAGLWKYLFSRSEYNILILGLDDAGKTTLLEQIKLVFKKSPGKQLPARIPPTVGLNVARIEIGNAAVTFWDVGGQVRLRGLWDRYYADSSALVFVLDSADPGRFEEARLAFGAVREQGDLHSLPILLIANKQDLPEACSVLEVADQFDTHKVVAAAPIRVLGLSALSSDGVHELVQWLVDEARKAALQP